MINAVLNWLIREGVHIIFDLIKWESSVTKYGRVHCGKAEHLPAAGNGATEFMQAAILSDS